jgi:hypothetical protein
MYNNIPKVPKPNNYTSNKEGSKEIISDKKNYFKFESKMNPKNANKPNYDKEYNFFDNNNKRCELLQINHLPGDSDSPRAEDEENPLLKPHEFKRQEIDPHINVHIEQGFNDTCYLLSQAYASIENNVLGINKIHQLVDNNMSTTMPSYTFIIAHTDSIITQLKSVEIDKYNNTNYKFFFDDHSNFVIKINKEHVDEYMRNSKGARTNSSKIKIIELITSKIYKMLSDQIPILKKPINPLNTTIDDLNDYSTLELNNQVLPIHQVTSQIIDDKIERIEFYSIANNTIMQNNFKELLAKKDPTVRWLISFCIKALDPKNPGGRHRVVLTDIIREKGNLEKIVIQNPWDTKELVQIALNDDFYKNADFIRVYKPR